MVVKPFNYCKEENYVIILVELGKERQSFAKAAPNVDWEPLSLIVTKELR